MASRPLLAYFSIACVVSWLAWLPRIATQQGWWGCFALGSPLVLFAIRATVARGVTGAWPAFAEVAKTGIMVLAVVALMRSVGRHLTGLSRGAGRRVSSSGGEGDGTP